MRQHNIGLYRFHHFFDTLENIDRHIKQCLLVFHNGEIMIRQYLECIQNLIEHLLVLISNTNSRFQKFPVFSVCLPAAQLNCFWRVAKTSIIFHAFLVLYIEHSAEECYFNV